MTVTSVEKDLDSLTLTVLADLAAPVERAWQLFADPRQLERWWGPPGYPATFVDHDLAPGGRCTYFMTSPEGDKYHGWWQITSAQAPTTLSLEDGFADGDGNALTDMPVTVMHVELGADGDRTRLTLESHFPDTAAMERLLEMGMDEGIREAAGQIDALLSES